MGTGITDPVLVIFGGLSLLTYLLGDSGWINFCLGVSLMLPLFYWTDDDLVWLFVYLFKGVSLFTLHTQPYEFLAGYKTNPRLTLQGKKYFAWWTLGVRNII